MPLLVTTFTPTGAARARALFGGAAEVRFLPFDLPGSVRRFLDRARPLLAVIMETELWPNLYRQCRRRRIPLIIASARLSRRSIDRYRRLGALFRETVSGGVVVAAQGEGDAERFRALGAAAERTHVTGNLKFDLTLPPDIGERGRALREQYAPSRAVWVAGSTHGGVGGGGCPRGAAASRRHPFRALLVLAPRHPNRFDEVAAWLERQGIAFARRSQSSAPAVAGESPQRAAARHAWRAALFLCGGRRGFRRRQSRPHRRPQPAGARGAGTAHPDRTQQFQRRGCGATAARVRRRKDRTQRRGARLASRRAALRSGTADGDGGARSCRRRAQSRRAAEAHASRCVVCWRREAQRRNVYSAPQ